MKILNKLFSPMLLSAFLAVVISSCTNEIGVVDRVKEPTNLTLNMNGSPLLRGGGPVVSEPQAAEVALGLKTFAFSDATAPTYSHIIPVKEVNGVIVKSNSPVGTWNLVMSYFRDQPSTQLLPSVGDDVNTIPMFSYTNTVPSGTDASLISNSAPEIFRSEQNVTLVSGATTEADGHIARNVAMVELSIVYSTFGINHLAAAGSHKIFLHNVPKTISYGGKLLKSLPGGGFEVNTIDPDTLSAPLEGRFVISEVIDAAGNYLKSDVVRFLIPAHQGDDFWRRNSGKVTDINPNSIDTTKLKMNLSVDLELTGGGRYQRTVEIPLVAQANKILRVNMTISSGVEINTDVLPWNYVSIDENVGENGNGAWIYVRKGSKGAGLSWSDALGTINDGIAKAQALKMAGSTVHGVLIAGGDSRPYTETINVTSGVGGIRLYGGWEGLAGTELRPIGEDQPNTAASRKLATHKVLINDNNCIILNDKVSYIDGFKITGAATVTPLTLKSSLQFAGIIANAIEIIGNSSPNTIISEPVTQDENTGDWGEMRMFNLLIANNKGDVSFGHEILMIYGASIVGNESDVTLSKISLHGSVIWGNLGTVSVTGNHPLLASSFNFCSVPIQQPGYTLLAPTNSDSNDVISIRGPHFNADDIPNIPYFMPKATSILIENGCDAEWWHASPYTKDVDGNERRVGLADAGCYEYQFTVPTQLSVIFHANDGTGRIISKGYYTSGDYVPFPNRDPIYPNYKFTGWYDKAIGGVKYTTSNITMPSQSLDIYAQWEHDNVVAYFANGANGGVAPPSSAAVAPGVYVPVADRGSLIRTGYNFVCWSEKADGTGPLYSSLGDDWSSQAIKKGVVMRAGGVKLYAQWTKNIIPHIILEPDGKLGLAEMATDVPLLFKFGSVVGVHSRQRRGAFDSANDIAFDPRENSTNRTWAGIMVYDPIFSGVGHTSDNVLKRGLGDPCKLVGLTSAEIAKGLVDNGIYKMHTMPEIIDHTTERMIWGVAEGVEGAFIMLTPDSAPSDLAFSPAVGYRGEQGAFDFWAKKSYRWNADKPISKSMVRAIRYMKGGYNTTAYSLENARMVRCVRDLNPNNHLLRFIANDGTPTVVSQVNYPAGNGIIFPADPTHSSAGFTFRGWYNQETGGVKYDTTVPVLMPASALNIYAQWNAPTYTVVFDGNGATSGTMTNQTFTLGVGQVLTLNTFTNGTRSFKGWNSKADGTGTSYGNSQSIAITANMTLYAQWGLQTYTVKFVRNSIGGGNAFMADQTFTEGVSQALSQVTFNSGTRPFTKWNTKADGTGISYNNLQVIMITEDLTLYAQWGMSPT